jgi:F420-dependent oxidoreductase-like protein
MRIGIFVAVGGAEGIDAVVDTTCRAENSGFHTAWFSNIFAHDGLTLCVIAGRETQSIEVGTAVVPTYPRHPAALAQQALTVQAAAHGRLALGIGLSHKIVIEQLLGLDYSKPIRHMREYLTVLNRLLAGEPPNFEGEEFTVRVPITVPGATKPPVLVAALGKQMLKLCGELADGTSTWMGGSKYLETQAIPIITKAASDARRPAPRIVAGMPAAVTADGDAARTAAAEQFAMYGQLPSYRAALDVEGSSDVTGACLIGDDAAVRAQLDHLASIGVTDVNAAPFPVPGDDGAMERTWAVLSDYAKRG